MLTYDVSSLGSPEFDRTVVRSPSLSGVVAKLTAFQFPMQGGVRLIPVQLIPEVSADQDFSPISIRWNGELLGHLPDEVAQEYQQILRLSASRCVATSFAKISEDGEELTVSLRSPGLLLPLNNPPRDPYALLPAITSLTLTHNEGLENILVDYLPPEDIGLLLVTLHNVEVLNQGNRQAVEVRLDGQRVGELPASETKNFKGTISHYAGLGMLTAATAQISGSQTAPLLRVTTTPAKRLTTSLLRPPSDHPLPTLVPFTENPQEYIIPEDFDALQLLDDAVVHISGTNSQENPDGTSVEDATISEGTSSVVPIQNPEGLDVATQNPHLNVEAGRGEANQEVTPPPAFFEVSSVADNHVVLMEPAPCHGTRAEDEASSDTQEIPLGHYEPPLCGTGPTFGAVSASPATITFGEGSPTTTSFDGDSAITTSFSVRKGVDKGIGDEDIPERRSSVEEVYFEEDTNHSLAIIGLIVGSLIVLFGGLYAVTSDSMLFFLGMAFLAFAAFAPALWWFYCEYSERGNQSAGGQRYWTLIILGAVASACAGILITWEAVTGAKEVNPSGDRPEPTILPELTSQTSRSGETTTSEEAPIAASEISLEPSSAEEEPSPSEGGQDSSPRNDSRNENNRPEARIGGEQPRGQQTPRAVVNPPENPRDNEQPQYTYITVYPEEEVVDPGQGNGEVYTEYEVVEEVVSEVPAPTPVQATPTPAASASASQPAPATSRAAG